MHHGGAIGFKVRASTHPHMVGPVNSAFGFFGRGVTSRVRQGIGGEAEVLATVESISYTRAGYRSTTRPDETQPFAGHGRHDLFAELAFLLHALEATTQPPLGLFGNRPHGRRDLAAAIRASTRAANRPQFR